MNSQFELNETDESQFEDSDKRDDPYSRARAKLAGRRKDSSKSSFTNRNEKAGRITNTRVIEDYPSSGFGSLKTIITLTASIATIFGALQGLSATPLATLWSWRSTTANAPVADDAVLLRDSGSLEMVLPDGQVTGTCPLKHTSVDAKVSGYTARVTVKQIFRNPFKEKIEARYRFPLSHNSAVDEMVMKVGNRKIKGDIKPREQARQVYTTAKDDGKVAALLDQERTNIFTQSIANLESGNEVEVTIKYTEILNYKDGAFQFVFPTVVGPRFQPYGSTESALVSQISSSGNESKHIFSAPLSLLTGGSTSVNTVTSGKRSGHDISINVSVDAGLPIRKLSSPLHPIITHQPNQNSAMVSLRQAATIPNRDFVLNINVAKERISSGYLATKQGAEGYVTFMVMPPNVVKPAEIAPRELIFLIDCSGSQGGKPIQKTRETLKYVLDRLNSNDTFQIMTFSDNVETLFSKPETMTLLRKIQAQMFIDRITARGGTWMAPAVEAACSIPADENRLRIVSFMTDGFVGNDYEIIELVKKLRGTSRWFPFGVGDSVNRTLIDRIAKEGGGESDFVFLDSSAEEIGKKFYDRIAAPVLTDVRIQAGDGLELKEIYPREISDVWSQNPLFFTAKYSKSGEGKVYIDGFSRGRRVTQAIRVSLPERLAENSQISQIWAREKIEHLTSLDWMGAQMGVTTPGVKDEIIKTALAHHLLSQYTSFVAVDESGRTAGGASVSIDVPVELPQGMASVSSTVMAQSSSGASSSRWQTGSSIASVASANSSSSSSASSYSSPHSHSYSSSQSPSSSSSSWSGNPIADKVFSGVVTRLNDLSAAGSACCPPYLGSPQIPTSSACSNLPAVTFTDIVLLPWSLVPTMLRAVIIAVLAMVAAYKATRIASRAASLEPVGYASPTLVALLILSIVMLTIGHWMILNYH